MSLIPQDKIEKKIVELTYPYYIDAEKALQNDIRDFIYWYNEQLIEEIEKMKIEYINIDNYRAGYNYALNDLTSKLKDQSLSDNKLTSDLDTTTG